MTSRCKFRPSFHRYRWCLLVTACAAIVAGTCAVAQEDGAKIPPPPAIKKHGEDNTPDPEFRSPLQGRRHPRQREDGGFQARMPGGPGGGPGVGPEGGPPGPGGEPIGPGGRRRPGGPMLGGGLIGGRRQLDLRPLNLSEEQKEKIKAMRQNTRTKARDLRKDMMEKQVALRELFFSPDATDMQIRTARRELRKAQDRLDEVNLEDLLSVRGVLTPEQKKRLPDIAPGHENIGEGPGGAERPGGFGARPGEFAGRGRFAEGPGGEQGQFFRGRRRANLGQQNGGPGGPEATGPVPGKNE